MRTLKDLDASMEKAVAAFERVSGHKPSVARVQSEEDRILELKEQLRILTPIHDVAEDAYNQARRTTFSASIAEGRAKRAFDEAARRLDLIKQELGLAPTMNDDENWEGA